MLADWLDTNQCNSCKIFLLDVATNIIYIKGCKLFPIQLGVSIPFRVAHDILFDNGFNVNPMRRFVGEMKRLLSQFDEISGGGEDATSKRWKNVVK